MTAADEAFALGIVALGVTMAAALTDCYGTFVVSLGVLTGCQWRLWRLALGSMPRKGE